MRLERIVLKNAKAISRLDATLDKRSIRKGSHTFYAPPVDLICAPNGQGKTTFLEAISLIGHIPCARLVSFVDNKAVVRPAWAENHWPTQVIKAEASFAISPDDTKILDEWVLSLRPSLLGAYFEIHDSEDNFGLIRFCVVLDVSVQTLTSLLSANLSDMEFSKYAFVIPASGCEDKVDGLIRAIARGRTFNPTIDFDREGPKRYVTYINTDMNDFGRGNDLRESPKTLNEEFKKQMVERIGIPFDTSTALSDTLVLRDLERLKAILKSVLTTPRYRFSTPDVVSPSLEILDFQIARGKLQIKVELKERKNAKFRNEQIIQNLSAGENETLFVFLMLLRMAGESCLILLDEPDLHVAGYMRPTLFKEIFRNFDTARQHLFIVSHSISAVNALKSYIFLTKANGGSERLDAKVRIKDHLRILLKVHPESQPHPEFRLRFDRGFMRTMQSGLMAGSITFKGWLGLFFEEAADFRSRFVSAMQKSNWAWYPFVGSSCTLIGACALWVIVSVIVPPEPNGKDTAHMGLVTLLGGTMIAALFPFVPTFFYGLWTTFRNKVED